MSISTILFIMVVLGILSIFLVLMIYLNGVIIHEKETTRKKSEAFIIGKYCNNLNVKKDVPNKHLLRAYLSISEQLVLSEEMRLKIYMDFQSTGLIDRYLSHLKSKSTFRRKEAIFYLSPFDSAEIKKSLLETLKTEKYEHVKIYILNALKNKIDQYVLQSIIDSIVGSRRFYQQRVIGILQQHLLQVEAHLQNIFRREEMEIKETFVDLTNIYYRKEFKQVLIDELHDIEGYLTGEFHPTFSQLKKQRVLRLYYQILRALASVYDTPLNYDKYLSHEDIEVVKIATESFAGQAEFSAVISLIKYADGSEADEIRAHTIIQILENNLTLFIDTLELVKTTTDQDQKALLAHVLSHKIEYLMLKLLYKDLDFLTKLLELMVEKGLTADLIDFMNRNQQEEVEANLYKILEPMLEKYPAFHRDMSEYLSPELLKLYKLKKAKPEAAKKEPIPEIRKTKWLLIWLFISIFSIPALYFLIISGKIPRMTSREIFTGYIISLNKGFIIYYLVVNIIYFSIATLSFFGAKRKRKLWSIKNNNLLFEKDMLPSISIIAPAYNEELSIVESVHSLLNLNYPNIEVIVVNDGSKDDTLNKLIEHFHLERKNQVQTELISTKPVRAIYRNRYISSLTVIDKENGGKADALNVGINYSQSEYICGIDADSILEKDSLLKLMSSMLDHDEITLALGGSIIPVNGHVVDHGQIESKHLSKSNLARFQTIEYLRAFNISRTGFATLKSLLIVSGAFGLFEKRILVEVGGYLTASSLKKDTVGEDMELVVRITRRAYEFGLNFRIDYLSQAKCYTEVPEERKSFFRQRNRWQRGLVDILSYHRSMIFNPKYRTVGFLGMPYFFVFEMLGPIFEIQAYLAIFFGLVLGILNVEIVLLLLLVSVVMGIFLSMLSLFINEQDGITFKAKDMMTLILYATIENFGWRQLISLFRVKGYLSSLRETGAWGQMNRLGFKK